MTEAAAASLASANEISNAAVAVVKAKLGGHLASKEEQRTALKPVLGGTDLEKV